MDFSDSRSKKELTKQIRRLLWNEDYQPMTRSGLAKYLDIPKPMRALFSRVLDGMEASGEIVPGKGRRYRLSPEKRDPSNGLVRGRIQFSQEQKIKSASFFPEDNTEHEAFKGMDQPRAFVPGRYASTAIDGDLVEVELVASKPPKWLRHSQRHRTRTAEELYQARVVRIVERGREQIVGKFFGKGSHLSLSPEDGRLPTSFRLVNALPEAQPGDMVVAKLVEWSNPHLQPTAEMIRVLGKESDPGVDILAVIHRFGLPIEFPDAVLAEVAQIPEEVSPEECVGREDWRLKEVFTIDPFDAKDFDDAICVTRLDNGAWELAVHIADVSHYVVPDSQLDTEALKRGNSVYLADRVIPMLPEALSNGVCSLKPGIDRLTQAAIIRFDAKGKVISSRYTPAVICSHRRYTYEEAYEILQQSDEQVAALADPKERALAQHIKRAWELASQLRQNRFRQGALDMEFPEIKVLMDENGRAVGVKKIDYDESHQLIEEFMLAANEAVAREINQASTSSLYRVHETPEPGRLEEFAHQARRFGHQVGDVTQRAELQKLLQNVRGKLEENSLKIALLKSLKRAQYSKAPLGHYGLAKTDYTHFTSPIRRYSDLIVHRVLQNVLAKRAGVPTRDLIPTPQASGMDGVAQHISRTERVAAGAEAETKKLKLIEYFEKICGDDENIIFPANVYEVRPIGVFVELDDFMVKGMIRKDDLPSRSGYYFDRNRGHFLSIKGTAATLAPGSRVQVRLVRVNRGRGFLDFELA